VNILQDILKVWKDVFEIEIIEVLQENNLFVSIAKVSLLFYSHYVQLLIPIRYWGRILIHGKTIFQIGLVIYLVVHSNTSEKRPSFR
jgi:hypothetical protein